MCEKLDTTHCNICGLVLPTTSRLITYDILCECHKGKHIEIIHTCRDCKDKIPDKTLIKITDIKEYVKISTDKLMYTIEVEPSFK